MVLIVDDLRGNKIRSILVDERCWGFYVNNVVDEYDDKRRRW